MLTLEILDSSKFVKVITTGWVSKWADKFGRAVLTDGSCKIQDRLIFLIPLLSQEIWQILLRGIVFLNGGNGLMMEPMMVLKSMMSNDFKCQSI